MNKVIALLENEDRILTTEKTALKNGYWITHRAETELVDDKTPYDPLCEPKADNVVMAVGKRKHRIKEVKPVYNCWECYDKKGELSFGPNSIGNKFYCLEHFNYYVRTLPVKRKDGSGKPRRNDKCYCGSGKKFKHCCLKKLEGKKIHYRNCRYEDES